MTTACIAPYKTAQIQKQQRLVSGDLLSAINPIGNGLLVFYGLGDSFNIAGLIVNPLFSSELIATITVIRRTAGFFLHRQHIKVCLLMAGRYLLRHFCDFSCLIYKIAIARVGKRLIVKTKQCSNFVSEKISFFVVCIP